jgi:hypothetical protein
MGPEEANYVVRKGYTDWRTKERFTAGQVLKLRREDLYRFRWALETRHMVKEGEE